MALTSNRAGNHYALTVLTPIRPGEEPALREDLEGLWKSGSPFAKVGRTHFGRWVIVPDFVNDPQQRKDDHLCIPYLLFSATFDGELEPYLDELCREMQPEAGRIWGRCIGCPPDGRGPELKAYLLHNQIHTGLFFSAYPEASVQTVRRCVRKRERAIALAIRVEGMPPAAAQQAFVEEFGTP